jgi:hypothetical protein
MLYKNFSPFLNVANKIKGSDYANDLSSVFTKSKIFLLNNDEIKCDVESNHDFLHYALPFKTCYFERCDEDTFLFSINTPKINIDVTSLLVHELEPNVLSVYIFGVMCVEGKSDHAVVDSFTIGEGSKDSRFSLIIHDICKKIHDSTLGHQTVNERSKIRNYKTGKKYIHKIKQVIRLKPKGVRGLFSLPSSDNIQWESRWWVRGHWRKVSSIGKDRLGNYGTRRHTWVKQHLKGPEHKEVVKKIYSL